VFYVLRRQYGDEEATATLTDLRHALQPEAASPARVVEPARITSDHPMAYADAFAAATAIGHNAELWTGDPELLVATASWQWVDLRV
jgi:predicted nucleic acid-binding protein